jgi:prevent-host-death family protein
MAKRIVTVHEAKTHLSRLLRRAAEGEQIVIARGKQPLARLVPLAEAGRPRRFGTASGLIRISPDFDRSLADFDEYTR